MMQAVVCGACNLSAMRWAADRRTDRRNRMATKKRVFISFDYDHEGPPFGEQESIRAYLDEKTGEVDRIVATIQSQIATLTTYRKSLIHECVTGQRRITDADAVRNGSASE